MKAPVRVFALCGVALLIAGCPQTPPSRPPPQTAVVPPTDTGVPRGAVIFGLDSQASSAQVLVRRGGALARFGHNHVMTVRELRGRIWLHADVTGSGFDFAFPVARMIVDDPAARSAAGSEFPGEIATADREATRGNMLRAEVLDAERYPQIQIRSIAVTGSVTHPQVSARITIRGASRDVSLSPSVQVDGDSITVAGEFDVSQTDFGITPFTAALGALQVQDRLHVQFKLVGRRAAS